MLGAQVLRYLPRPDPPVLMRLAPDDGPFAAAVAADDLALVLDRTTRFVVTTPEHETELVEHGVLRDRIARVAHPHLLLTEDRAAARRDLGLPAAGLVVGCLSEPADPPDLVVEIAAGLAGTARGRAAKLLALVPEPAWVLHDLERLGLGDVVTVTRSGRGSRRALLACDVVAFVGRDERVPQPCHDAALHGIPVVCFDRTDLAETIGRDRGGISVPYADGRAAAAAVAELVSDERRRHAAAAWLHARHGPVGFAEALRSEVRSMTSRAAR